jgi:3-hydroxyisobutyrate dehydrogenase
MTDAVTPERARPPRVGFVGLGKMGWPMARNLAAAGHPLTVHDADPGRQASFAAEHGCDGAAGPGAFAAAGIVVTMLPDDAAVRNAVLDRQGGIAPALASGSVVVDMSSSSPVATRELGRRLSELGLGLVDCPVSGGVVRAEEGTLTLMVGGGDEDVERVRPVLDVLGERLYRTGALGTGHAMKALNNLVGGTTYAVVVEALAIGERYGLDPRVMVEILNASTGRSFNTEHVVKDHVLTGRYGTGFALGLLAKDVGIAAALAAELEVDAPLAGLVSGRLQEAAAALGPAVDHSEAHKHWWEARLDRDTEVTG